MTGRYERFIDANRRLWAGVEARRPGDGLLLVEPQFHPMISHTSAVIARAVKEATGLRIGWVDGGSADICRRLRSYDDSSHVVPMPMLSGREVARLVPLYGHLAAGLLRGGDILDIAVDGTRLGDIVYDAHLAQAKLATVRGLSAGLLRTLWTVVRNCMRFSKLIEQSGAAAVLVSHEVGSLSGVLMRTGLRRGLPVYLCRSGVQLNLKRSLADIYLNSDKPRPVDMAALAAFPPERLDGEFAALISSRMQPGGDVDAGRAYGSKRVFRAKQELAAAIGIDAQRPCVFVMLHAFNDHPHSHFGRMLFRDYYDWFAQTLRFARDQRSVNWIFKEHPSAAFYPTRDISLADHFRERRPPVFFLDREADFSSESLLHVADAIVTVAGTAAVEFGAAAAVPSVLAGGTSYTGFGFTREPATQSEYFSTLATIDAIARLTPAQQRTAQQVFLYSERYASVPFSWLPEVSYQEEKDPALDDSFWDQMPALYESRREQLLTEFRALVEQIGRPDFSRLTRLC
jgi:hypothetical protein